MKYLYRDRQLYIIINDVGCPGSWLVLFHLQLSGKEQSNGYISIQWVNKRQELVVVTVSEDRRERRGRRERRERRDHWLNCWSVFGARPDCGYCTRSVQLPGLAGWLAGWLVPSSAGKVRRHSSTAPQLQSSSQTEIEYQFFWLAGCTKL